MKKTEKPKQPSQAEALAELRSLIEKAKTGDRSVLPRLHHFLDANPVLWKGPGNIALQAQASWVKLISGSNLHLQQCLARQVNQLKQNLSGESPTAVEALLIERIVTGWLQLGYVESREAQSETKDLKWAQFRMQRQSQAERQFRAAIDALATLRRLAKTITVEVRQPPMASQEPISADRVNGSRPASPNGRAASRFNGHNRFSDLLEPAAEN